MVKPTKTQSGGLLRPLLGSIGIPLALEVIKGIIGKGAPRVGRSRRKGATRVGRSRGKGAPRIGRLKGKGAPRVGIYTPPPPFFGQWPDGKVGGQRPGTKKKWERTSVRSQQPVQQHSGARCVFVKPKFVKKKKKTLRNFFKRRTHARGA